MRHRLSGRRLNRDASHRKALRKNMVADLIAHEKIVTTEAKARMLRPVAEKMITLAKRGVARGKIDPSKEIHARRLVAARMAKNRVVEDEEGDLYEVDAIKKLFNEIAPRYADRNGGYTRMVKMGPRSGDNAKMAVLMLVEEE
jgi:large subunit ribosomal protein L17